MKVAVREDWPSARTRTAKSGPPLYGGTPFLKVVAGFVVAVRQHSTLTNGLQPRGGL